MSHDQPDYGFMTLTPDQMEMEVHMILNSTSHPNPGMALDWGECALTVKPCLDGDPECHAHWYMQGKADPLLYPDMVWAMMGWVEGDTHEWVVALDPSWDATIKSYWATKGYIAVSGHIPRDAELPEGIEGGGKFNEVDPEFIRRMIENPDELD